MSYIMSFWQSCTWQSKQAHNLTYHTLWNGHIPFMENEHVYGHSALKVDGIMCKDSLRVLVRICYWSVFFDDVDYIHRGFFTMLSLGALVSVILEITKLELSGEVLLFLNERLDHNSIALVHSDICYKYTQPHWHIIKTHEMAWVI